MAKKKTNTGGADDSASMRAGISAAIDMQAAMRYLLRDWDVTAEPHLLHAQFSAMEACVERTEKVLCNALNAANAVGVVHQQEPAPVPSHELLLAFDASAEIECLVASLRGIVSKEAQAMGDEAAILLQSGLKNIKRLNSVVMSVATREGRVFAELYKQVHDELPNSQPEVNYA